MKIRPFYSISILAIVLGLCAIGWLVFQPKQMEPVITYKSVTPESRTAGNGQSAEERYEATLKERTARDIEYMLESGTDNADMQALKKAMQSPEYLEYKRKQDAIFPGFNLVLWWDFLESQGIKSSARELQEKNFRECFPTGDYADYEPIMRKKLAELFLELDLPVDGMDKQTVREYTLAVLNEFRSDWNHKIWMRGYFNGYDGDVAWADNVRQNAANIVTELTPADIDTSPLRTESVTMPNTTHRVEEVSDTVSLPNTHTEALPALKDLAQVPQTIQRTEPEPVKQHTPDIPGFLTETQFQDTLRAHFSPERLNRALATLNRYGSEEGLQRLKESDPEVATRLENFIQPNKERD
ncbi:hypothetical protein C6503_16585 [Candidatus Poribacteria bacterium]|nr:MAG: hypothetical protein C6503_16585 [Candidatus Poribacteria bacterium]